MGWIFFFICEGSASAINRDSSSAFEAMDSELACSESTTFYVSFSDESHSKIKERSILEFQRIYSVITFPGWQ